MASHSVRDNSRVEVNNAREAMQRGVKATFTRSLDKLMLNFTEDLDGKPLEKTMPEYKRQFEILHGSTVYRVTRFLNKGGYGAAFVARQLIPVSSNNSNVMSDGDNNNTGAMMIDSENNEQSMREGKAVVMKFFHGHAQGIHELEKLEVMFKERRVQHHDCIIDVLFFQKEPLLPGHVATKSPGQFGMLCMKLGHLGEPLDYIGANGTKMVGFPGIYIYTYIYIV